MKRRYFAFAFALLLSTAPMAVSAMSSSMLALTELQDEWARIKYQTPDEALRKPAIERLSLHAAELAKTYPSSPEIKVWQAIILATKAGINGGLVRLAM